MSDSGARASRGDHSFINCTRMSLFLLLATLADLLCSFQPQILIGRFLINLRRTVQGGTSSNHVSGASSGLSGMQFVASSSRLGNIGGELAHGDDFVHDDE